MSISVYVNGLDINTWDGLLNLNPWPSPLWTHGAHKVLGYIESSKE